MHDRLFPLILIIKHITTEKTEKTAPFVEVKYHYYIVL